MNHFLLTQQLVKNILLKADSYEWTIQGLGMLRTYLSKDVRLHIWHQDAIETDVSELHTHPWDFESLIIAGKMTDYVYHEKQSATLRYLRSDLQCGEGGCLMGDPTPVNLACIHKGEYEPGQSYHRDAEQIHRSVFEDGTVTLIRRFFHEDEDHALVYWPVGDKWGSAEPRPASEAEVLSITQAALRNFK